MISRISVRPFTRPKNPEAEFLRQLVFESPLLRPKFEADVKKNKFHADVSALGEMGLDTWPLWEDGAFQKAMEEKILDWNETHEPGFVLLPKETEEFGKVEKIRPSNMIFFELGPEARDRVLRVEKHFSRSNPFQTLWESLRREGITAKDGAPTFYNSREELDKDRTTRLRYTGLDQKRHERLREDKEKAGWF